MLSWKMPPLPPTKKENSVPKVRGFEWTQFALTSHMVNINVNKKSWYTPHLKDNLILIVFYQKTWVVWALLLQLCVVKVTDDVIAEKLYIPSQNYRNFCLNSPNQVKL